VDTLILVLSVSWR